MAKVAFEKNRVAAGACVNQSTYKISGGGMVLAHPIVIFMQDRGTGYGRDLDAVEMESRGEELRRELTIVCFKSS